jgi:hypothetical protein
MKNFSVIAALLGCINAIQLSEPTLLEIEDLRFKTINTDHKTTLTIV